MTSNSRGLVILSLLAVIILSSTPSANALKETLSIQDDARRAFLVRSFGFATGGKLNVVIHDLEVFAPRGANVTKDDVALVIERSPEATRIDTSNSPPNEKRRVCFHREDIRAEDTEIIKLGVGFSRDNREVIRTISTPGFYHIYFSNCVPSSTVTLKMYISEYNVKPNGEMNYLSVGEQELPLLYFIFSGLALIQIVCWLVILITNGSDTKSIHILMALVLFFKFLSLGSEGFKWQALAHDGTNSGFAISFYVFNAIRGFLMFAVIILIGTGWTYLKPFLTDRDKQLILVIVAIQILVNIAWIYVDATSPGSVGWVTWNEILLIMDIICCGLTTLPIMWSVSHLERETERDGKLAASFQRLKNFRSFYLSVLVYVYFTRIVVFLLSTMIPYDFIWVASAFREIASLVFFFYVGSLFKPQPVNPYLALETGGQTSESADIELGMRSRHLNGTSGRSVSGSTGTRTDDEGLGDGVQMADTMDNRDDFDDDTDGHISSEVPKKVRIGGDKLA